MIKARNVTVKTRLLLTAGALFLVMLGAPARAGFAQNSDPATMANRIQQLENQVQTLSQAVYRGDKGAMAAAMNAPAPGGAAMSAYEDRLGRLEQQQRDMTGQIEKLGYDVQQMKTQLDKALADNELRFQQLSGGKTPPPAADMPAPATGDDVKSSGNSTGGTLGNLSTAPGGDPAAALYESGFADVRDAKYDAAEAKFKQFIKDYPKHALMPNVQYWLAETYYVRGNYQQSAKMFAQGYQDYPKGPKAADSLLKLGLSLGKLGKKDDACLSFQQLKKQFASEQSTVVRRAEQEMKTAGCK